MGLGSNTGTSLAFPSLLLVQLPLGSHHQRVKLYSGMGGQGNLLTFLLDKLQYSFNKKRSKTTNIKSPLGAIPFQIITTTTNIVTSGVDYYLVLYNFVRITLGVDYYLQIANVVNNYW